MPITVTVKPDDQQLIGRVWVIHETAECVLLSIETASKIPPLESTGSRHPENERTVTFTGGIQVVIAGIPWQNIDGPLLLSGRGYLEVMFYDPDTVGKNPELLWESSEH